MDDFTLDAQGRAIRDAAREFVKNEVEEVFGLPLLKVVTVTGTSKAVANGHYRFLER